jgi:hypothetical protein
MSAQPRTSCKQIVIEGMYVKRGWPGGIVTTPLRYQPEIVLLTGSSGSLSILCDLFEMTIVLSEI